MGEREGGDGLNPFSKRMKLGGEWKVFQGDFSEGFPDGVLFSDWWCAFDRTNGETLHYYLKLPE